VGTGRLLRGGPSRGQARPHLATLASRPVRCGVDSVDGGPEPVSGRLQAGRRRSQPLTGLDERTLDELPLACFDPLDGTGMLAAFGIHAFLLTDGGSTLGLGCLLRLGGRLVSLGQRLQLCCDLRDMVVECPGQLGLCGLDGRDLRGRVLGGDLQRPAVRLQRGVGLDKSGAIGYRCPGVGIQAGILSANLGGLGFELRGLEAEHSGQPPVLVALASRHVGPVPEIAALCLDRVVATPRRGGLVLRDLGRIEQRPLEPGCLGTNPLAPAGCGGHRAVSLTERGHLRLRLGAEIPFGRVHGPLRDLGGRLAEEIPHRRDPSFVGDEAQEVPDERTGRVDAREQRVDAALGGVHLGEVPEQVRVEAADSGKITYEVGGNLDAMSLGGIAAVHRMVTKLGLPAQIDDGLELLKVHLPYHESDHVLNLAYNVLCGGTRLEDIERLRHDTAYMNALGAELIPDPTTAGDFCRRFTEADVVELMDRINAVRPLLWRTRGRDLLGPVAYIDIDGTMVPTDGRRKAGIGLSYKGIWGYGPLLVTLANTKEVLYLVNRPGNAPSHADAAEWIDRAIDLVSAHAPRLCLRGDTDFALTAHFDRWADRVDFVFGMDAGAALTRRAEAYTLPTTPAWLAGVPMLSRPRRPAPGSGDDTGLPAVPVNTDRSDGSPVVSDGRVC